MNSFRWLRVTHINWTGHNKLQLARNIWLCLNIFRNMRRGFLVCALEQVVSHLVRLNNRIVCCKCRNGNAIQTQYNNNIVDIDVNCATPTENTVVRPCGKKKYDKQKSIKTLCFLFVFEIASSNEFGAEKKKLKEQMKQQQKMKMKRESNCECNFHWVSYQLQHTIANIMFFVRPVNMLDNKNSIKIASRKVIMKKP